LAASASSTIRWCQCSGVAITYGIDILPREHFPVIFGCCNGAVELLCGGQVPVVQIGDSDHTDSLIRIEQSQVRAALDADTDESQIDLVVRAVGPAGFRQRSDAENRASRAHEASSVESHTRSS
jgi:hypothetical protein